MSVGGSEGEVPVMEMRTLVLERLRQVDTVGTTESAEFGNTVVKVNVAEAGAGVIEAGARGADHGGGAGRRR